MKTELIGAHAPSAKAGASSEMAVSDFLEIMLILYLMYSSCCSLIQAHECPENPGRSREHAELLL